MKLLRQLVLTALLLAAAVPVVRAGGSPAEDVPLDSWVYDAVFELSSRGHFDNLLLHTRPYSRGNVAEGLRALIQSEPMLAPGTRHLVARLQKEFTEELGANSSETEKEYARLGGGPTGRTDQYRHGVHSNRIGFDALASVGVGDRVSARVRLRVDSDGRADSTFHGEYWKEKFTAWIDQAVLTASIWRLRLAFGREFWRWGRSPVDAMLISDQSPPFDGLRASYRSRRWAFMFHATMLDSMMMEGSPAARRYLIGHRLDWRPRGNLELAISEVIIFGGAGRPWALNYLNPFVPYYWEQLNNDTNDNPLWNLEASWRPRRNLEFYGEWFIDDFQIDFKSEPQQIGVVIGGALSTGPGERLFLNAEYQRINTFVYGQGKPHNRYYHHRDLNNQLIGIGSDLGPDADRITFHPKWRHSRHLDIMGLLEHIRRGADRIDSLQQTAVPKNVPFPSGTVESRTTVGIGAHMQDGGRLIADLMAGYETVSNIENEAGRDRQGVVFRARVSVLFWKTLGI